MENMIVIILLLAIVALAVFYVIRTKKNGRKCIGCPGGCEKCSCGCMQYDRNASEDP